MSLQPTMTLLYDRLWNARDKSVIDELFSPDFQAHNLAFPDAEGAGIDGFKTAVDHIYFAFPDMVFTLDESIEQGKRIALRWHGEGVWAQDFLGLTATQQVVYYAGMSMVRTQGGLITEAWVMDNGLDL